jgi:hypothetical protein
MAGGAIYLGLNQRATAQADQDIYCLLSGMAIGMMGAPFFQVKTNQARAQLKESMHWQLLVH